MHDMTNVINQTLINSSMGNTWQEHCISNHSHNVEEKDRN